MCMRAARIDWMEWSSMAFNTEAHSTAHHWTSDRKLNMIFEKSVHFATWFAVAMAYKTAHNSRQIRSPAYAAPFVLCFTFRSTDADTYTMNTFAICITTSGRECVACAWCNNWSVLSIYWYWLPDWVFMWNQSAKIDTCIESGPRLSAMCVSWPAQPCQFQEIHLADTELTFRVLFTLWSQYQVRPTPRRDDISLRFVLTFNETVLLSNAIWSCVKI